MKKRLRKKKHLGEFAVFGYSLEICTKSHNDEDFFDRFINEIELLQLQFGGSMCTQIIKGVLESRFPNRSVSESQLYSLKSFLATALEVDSIYISEAWDLYYGQEPLKS